MFSISHKDIVSVANMSVNQSGKEPSPGVKHTRGWARDTIRLRNQPLATQIYTKFSLFDPFLGRGI